MYAVQPGRGKRSVARILVVSVRPEMIGTISQAEAEREGFRSVAEFVARWLSLYGSVAWTDPVWRIEFELVDGEGCAA